MNPPNAVLPEWEVPVAVPVVTQEPMSSLLREIINRDIANVKSLGGTGLLIVLVILWRRAMRRPVP